MTTACAKTELALGALLGLSCWLRPEGVLLAAMALAYRAVFATRLGIRWRSAVFRSVLFAVPFGVVAGALVAFHVSQTGYVLPGSALSLSLSYIGRIENGKSHPSRVALQALGLALGVDPVWLAQGKGELTSMRGEVTRDLYLTKRFPAGRTRYRTVPLGDAIGGRPVSRATLNQAKVDSCLAGDPRAAEG